MLKLQYFGHLMWRVDSLEKILMLAGKDWRQEVKGMTEDEMVGCYHGLNRHESEKTLEDSKGQGILVCYSPWGCKELDTTDWTTTSVVGPRTVASVTSGWVSPAGKQTFSGELRLQCFLNVSAIPGKSQGRHSLPTTGEGMSTHWMDDQEIRAVSSGPHITQSAKVTLKSWQNKASLTPSSSCFWDSDPTCLMRQPWILERKGRKPCPPISFLD